MMNREYDAGNEWYAYRTLSPVRNRGPSAMNQVKGDASSGLHAEHRP